MVSPSLVATTGDRVRWSSGAIKRSTSGQAVGTIAESVSQSLRDGYGQFFGCTGRAGLGHGYEP